MPTYLSPGVYVEEVPTGSAPIGGVGTAIAAFIGMAPQGPVNTPTMVLNWRQYVDKFGDVMAGAYLGHAVYGYFLNGGGTCYVVRVGADGNGEVDGGSVRLSPARARIGALEVRALEPGPEGNSTTVEVLDPSEGSREGTVRVIVSRGDQREDHDAVPLSGRGNVINSLNRGRLVRAELDSAVAQLEDLPRGVTSLSGGELVHVDVAQAYLSPDDYIGDAADRTGCAGLEAVPEVTMIAVPDAMSAYQKGVIDFEGLRAIQLGTIAHCELMGNRVAILDAPPNLNSQQVRDWRLDQAGYDSKFAAVYYPWIKVFDPASGTNVFVPPSGHVAGVFGRNDDTRGVHKAPANEVIRGAIDLEINITKGEHDLLNPVAVNCIRAFPGRGIRIWGARTLSSEPEWRYLNVRRLFNYLEDSILNGTQWAVFEPNDRTLWAKVRRGIAAFLTTEWRKGALFGATPGEAFFVNCNDETNPAEAIDLGQLTCEIGVAPVKPAEFVIFRLSQFSGGTSLVAE
jgi:Bacteriophage tail sheath protein